MRGLQESTPAGRPALVIGGAEPCASCGARLRSVCGALPEGDLDILAKVAVQLTLDPGRVFIDEGAPAEYFFNIIGGTVKIYKLLADGRRQITGFLSVGDFLGLAHDRLYAYGAEAVDRVRLCRFSRRKLEVVFDEHREMERRLRDKTSHELVAAQDQLLLLGRKTAREKVASFLLARTCCPAACRQVGTTVELPMTRGDIADYLGLTIETVSRALSRLRAEGIIALDGLHRVALLDHAALDGIAAGLGSAA